MRHQFVTNNRGTWLRAREAVMDKITKDSRSAKILETEGLEGEKISNKGESVPPQPEAR